MAEIIVTADKTLEEIAQAFHSKFPFLKLEFFSHRHAEDEVSPKKDKLDTNLTIGEAGTFDHEEELSIHGNLKVATLEKNFQDLYGIGLQVLRRSGQLWIQTATTDDWTLSKQNQEGEYDSMPAEG